MKTEGGKTDWIISAQLHAGDEYMNKGSRNNQGEKIEDACFKTGLVQTDRTVFFEQCTSSEKNSLTVKIKNDSRWDYKQK